MPTFKADFVHYDAEKGEKENLLSLMEQYNELVQRLNFTVNGLDEENFGASVLKQIGSAEGTNGTS